MINRIFNIFLLFCFLSCTDKNTPGIEYMPDMYRSIAVETYQSSENSDIFGTISSSLLPVEGTVPRGFMPFEYEDTEEDYLRAGRELVNPVDLNKDILEEGKELYKMFCAHCHGKKGDGESSIKHPIYSNVPSYTDEILIRRSNTTMSDLKSGHIFHAITYGINGTGMGPHASQISQEDRWKIVHYVNTLQ